MSSSTDDKSKRDGGVPLSASFDKVYEEYRELMNPEDSTSSSVYQVSINCIGIFLLKPIRISFNHVVFFLFGRQECRNA